MASQSGIKTVKNYPLHTPTAHGESFKALYECPINEDNIESVLDESIAATASMRTQLAALKDDLKRLGGGSSMSAAHLKPVHLQRRMEVATHLADAFAKYQKTIDTIGEFNQLPDLDFSQGAWSMSEVGGSQRGTPGRGGKGSRGPYGKRGAGRGVSASVPHTSEKLRDIKLPDGHSATKLPVLSPSQSLSASGVRPQHTTTRVTVVPSAAQIANDLWMSCEPGSEDEESYGTTGKRKKR